MLNCVHCGKPIRRDAARGLWPRGPVGPRCRLDRAIRQYLAAQREAQRVARQPIGGSTRYQVRRAAVVAAIHADPRQMALELEAAAC